MPERDGDFAHRPVAGTSLRRPRVDVALVAILAFAALVRLAMAWLIEVDPRATFQHDQTWYDLAAVQFSNGVVLRDLTGVATAKWAPGYPLLLGAVYRIFGDDLMIARCLNVVLSTLTVGFTFVLARRIFDRTTALVAAAIMAGLPGHALYVPLVMSETAFLAAFTGVLVVLTRPGRGRNVGGVAPWVGCGVVLGVAILIRGAAALFLVVPAVVWWMTTGSFRLALRRGVLAAVGVALLVVPWTVRNYLTMGAPVILSTQQAGMLLTYSHSEVATGGMSLSMARHRDALLAEYKDLPQPEKEIAENRAEVRQALAYMWNNPGRELQLVPRRLFYLFAHDHAALAWASVVPAKGEAVAPIVSATVDQILRWIADLYFYAMLVMALLGLGVSRRLGAQPEWILLPATIVYFLGLHGVLFAGDPRFHTPLYPVLAILAAVALRSFKIADSDQLGPIARSRSRTVEGS